MGFLIHFTDDNGKSLGDYNSDACELSFPNGDHKPVLITGDLKTIFEFLIEHRNQALYRDQITARLEGREYYNEDNKTADRSSVDSQICLLRKKLKKIGPIIKTIYGVGYMYKGPEKVVVVQNETEQSSEDKSNNNGKSSSKKGTSSSFPVGYSKRPNLTLDPRKLDDHSWKQLKLRMDHLVLISDETELEAEMHLSSIPIKIFVNAIKRLYLSQYGEYSSETWANVQEYFQNWLLDFVGYYHERIKQECDPSKLTEAKQDQLDLIHFHFTIAMLTAQLELVEQLREKAVNQAEKEILSKQFEALNNELHIMKDQLNELKAGLASQIEQLNQTQSI